jgi:hypothetical protein
MSKPRRVVIRIQRPRHPTPEPAPAPPRKRMSRRAGWVVLLGVAIALPVALIAIGRQSGPRAPLLGNEPVYQNSKLGLKFLAPEGWPVSARADLPPGPLPRPIVLIMYVQNQGEKPAEFELMAADVPDGGDLGQFLAEHRIGSEKWAKKGGESPVTVNGTTGTRFVMTRGTGRNEFRREVTAFRRGERVYFFVVSFGAADVDHRDQVRKSVESVEWSN